MVKSIEYTDKIAQIISIVTQPPLLIFILTSMICFQDYSLTKFESYLVSVLLLTIVPISSIYLWSRHIGEKCGEISSRSKRLVPYTLSIASFCICVFLVSSLCYDPRYLLISLSLLISSIILLFLNFFIKISVHVSGVSLFCSIGGCLYQIWSIPLFLLIGLVFWSRHHLSKHTYDQMIYGTIVGFIVPFIVCYVLNSNGTF